MTRYVTAATAALLLGAAAQLTAAHLYPEATGAWNIYIRATETRIARELNSPGGFLALDFAPGAPAARRSLLAGDVIVEPMAATGANGQTIEVPSALVHHWRGAVLIPRITVSALVAQLQNGAPPTRQEDVLESRVLERKPDWMRVSLKLQRKKIVTVVYNTEHVVTFVRDGASRARSESTATRIVEVADVNTPQEHELPAGDDRGFLWRLNAYWRYQQAGDGVIAECESVTLSRDVPSMVKFLVMPLIEHAARESMARTLIALRARFWQA